MRKDTRVLAKLHEDAIWEVRDYMKCALKFGYDIADYNAINGMIHGYFMIDILTLKEWSFYYNVNIRLFEKYAR